MGDLAIQEARYEPHLQALDAEEPDEHEMVEPYWISRAMKGCSDLINRSEAFRRRQRFGCLVHEIGISWRAVCLCP
jgi:hypothetical protein